MNDEFYIGWEAKAPSAISRAARKTICALFMVGIAASITFAAAQRMIGASAFEWGTQKTVSGVLRLSPYPYLLVARPGQVGPLDCFSTYCLVAPGKFGLSPGTLASLEGRVVSVKGTLIYRESQTMLETKPDWIHLAEKSAGAEPPGATSLGKQTLVGEIVDSKCFFGVMNPGQLATHRACAVRCISGGCPPVFLVREKDGRAVCFLLVSAAGKPVNQQVLGMVAEPLEMTGEVVRQGDLLILKADPETYRKHRD
ncbi:MAG TPA: hypothetical protein VHB20_02315 [Verrucomicrobiae bacterium]|jgi:hypothetical protein|nr:hypothetical protein [Verrucomicrobiae bacterium]